ncbi:MAG: MBL fold metallo-hydrolase [Anaerolineales bacterium]|jgi:glyoxylase-like metal-dependent hydrolase (beta-lactamase superfamily II)
MAPSLEVHHSGQGARIYRLPLHLFPGLWGYAHLICWQDLVALVDVGSGFGESNEHLEAGLAAVRQEHGEQVDWDRLTHVLITHGHLDHFGGLGYVRKRTKALVGVHELDLRVLTNYEERLTIIAHRLREYLTEIGLNLDERNAIMSLYLVNKQLFSSVLVDFTFEAEGMRLGPLRMLHVPGHCPGHVVIQVDDVLLSGDHVLKETSPHQAPECLSLSTGLGHYLASLARLLPIADSFRVTLGGHEGPIEDLKARINAIEMVHQERLEKVLELLQEPKTVSEVSEALFPDVGGYHVLLALEEAGAHVEFLYQRGYLSIENLEALENEGAVPIRYRRREGFAPTLNLPRLAVAQAGLALNHHRHPEQAHRSSVERG